MSRRLSALLVVVILSIPGLATNQRQVTANPAPAGPGEDFSTAIAPMLRQYCTSCHGGSKPKAKLDLSALGTEAAFRDRPELLEDMGVHLRERTMPPVDRPQPSAAERERLERWVEVTRQAALKETK